MSRVNCQLRLTPLQPKPPQTQIVINNSGCSCLLLLNSLLDILQKLYQLSLFTLNLKSSPDPIPRLLQSSHLSQTPSPSPPSLCISYPARLNTCMGIHSALSPVLHRHVRLCSVRQNSADLLSHQLGGLPHGSLHGHLE